jgi:hypothetical protein
MAAKAFVSVLVLIPALCLAEQDSNSKTCDGIATIAAAAVQKKNDGVDFITFSKNLDEVDATDEAKAALKYVVAKAYSSSTTPEEAYSSTFMDCMTSMEN